MPNSLDTKPGSVPSRVQELDVGLMNSPFGLGGPSALRSEPRRRVESKRASTCPSGMVLRESEQLIAWDDHYGEPPKRRLSRKSYQWSFGGQEYASTPKWKPLILQIGQEYASTPKWKPLILQIPPQFAVAHAPTSACHEPSTPFKNGSEIRHVEIRQFPFVARINNDHRTT